MKVAMTGKGGVGKSTLSAILAHLAHRDGRTVLAVDADPDANLAFTLGMPPADIARIVPISRRADLIEERTGARMKEFGQLFRLNPEVSDVADRFGSDVGGIRLVVLGAVEAGGSGCACPESVFLRALLSDIILRQGDFVIADMEAGIEHLGRGTARAVDVMVVVVEPAFQSVNTAMSITRLAREIGVERVRFVGNKIVSESDAEYLEKSLGPADILGLVPHSDVIRRSDRDRLPLIDQLPGTVLEACTTVYRRLLSLGGKECCGSARS